MEQFKIEDGRELAKFSNIADMRAGDLLGEVEHWIKDTSSGKRWLARMAADVGVPIQMLLPFEEND